MVARNHFLNNRNLLLNAVHRLVAATKQVGAKHGGEIGGHHLVDGRVVGDPPQVSHEIPQHAVVACG